MLGADWLWARLAGWARRGAAAALAAPGRPVPRHVAFIMDGNRRYAEARSLRRVEGHAYGYARLIDALEWCLQLGVRCVSVYAFSIDNYRRSGEEVATLMALAEEKLAHMLREHDVLERHGVRVCVLGDLSLAPAGVRAAAARVMAATAHHDRAVLNLCFSYTASEELQRALDCLAAEPAAAGGGAAALEARLYTCGCPPVDLLVRTSGETRLSDFLLWQCRHALLVFTPVLWPDFGFLDLAAAVLEFQRHARHLGRLRQAAEAQAAAAAAGTAPAGAAAEALAGASASIAGSGLCAQLPPVKTSPGRRHGSPCSVASPALPSSPSSRSEDVASDEDASMAAAAAAAAAAIATASAAVAAAAGPAAAALRLRHHTGGAA